jgi:hypothetical protein
MLTNYFARQHTDAINAQLQAQTAAISAAEARRQSELLTMASWTVNIHEKWLRVRSR